MTAAEEGVLLLCCRLGDADSKPLTMAQFRDLGLRVRASLPEGDPLSDLTRRDLVRLGYTDQEAARILGLLSRQSRLRDYVGFGEQRHIFPVTRISPDYPKRIAQKRQLSCPPVLFVRGNTALLNLPSVAVVGSRQLYPENEAFARRAGQLAAREHLALISGNAIGADRAAQNGCLDAGGCCVIFAADRLMDHASHDRMLFVSEDGYDLPFSPARALHRNGLIHMQGDKTIAAQCTYGKGGTWEGCLDNLKHGWSPLFVFDDGSKGASALMERGASGVKTLEHIGSLTPEQMTLFH